MYLLYLDDSGDARNVNDSHIVLGGVCLHENKVYYLNQYLDELAAEAYPDNPHSIEFHASTIWAGKEGPWRDLKKPKRAEYIRRVLNAVNRECRDTCLFACAVHKESYPARDPWEMAFEDLCSRFDLFLNRIYHQKNERHRGILILDETSYEGVFQNLARNFRINGTRWRVTANLQEVPLCVDSKSSRCIQLADHVAYAIFRRYQYGDLNYFNVIENRFDADEERIHGLSHIHTQPSCTCPPCLTKKLTGGY